MYLLYLTSFDVLCRCTWCTWPLSIRCVDAIVVLDLSWCACCTWPLSMCFFKELDFLLLTLWIVAQKCCTDVNTWLCWPASRSLTTRLSITHVDNVTDSLLKIALMRFFWSTLPMLISDFTELDPDDVVNVDERSVSSVDHTDARNWSWSGHQTVEKLLSDDDVNLLNVEEVEHYCGCPRRSSQWTCRWWPVASTGCAWYRCAESIQCQFWCWFWCQFSWGRFRCQMLTLMSIILRSIPMSDWLRRQSSWGRFYVNDESMLIAKAILSSITPIDVTLLWTSISTRWWGWCPIRLVAIADDIAEAVELL